MKCAILFLSLCLACFAQPYDTTTGKRLDAWPDTINTGNVIIHNATKEDCLAHGYEDRATVTNIVVTTNLTRLAICQKAQQIALIVTNFPDMVAETGYDFPAMLEWGETHSAELIADGRMPMATTMRDLWPKVAPYAPDGLPNFKPYTVTTNREVVVRPKD